MQDNSKTDEITRKQIGAGTMKKFKCEEMMCNHCVSRIDMALTEAKIDHTIELESKTVTIEGCEQCEKSAVQILDDLGYTPIEM